MMNYLIIGLILVEVFFQVRAVSAVRGSRQRYVALSLRRVASWLINFAFIAQGLLEIAANQPTVALWNLVFGVFCSIIEVRNHRNDDDWFTGRGAKIKRGIRKLLTAPRGARAPAPAFGMTAA